LTLNQRLSLLFLCALTFFIWGVSMVAFEVFPHNVLQPTIEEIKAWLDGVDEGEQLTWTQKIDADFFGKDIRYMATSAIEKKLKLELDAVSDPRELLKDSPQNLKYFSLVKDGYFVFYTILNLPDAKFGAVVVSARGEIEHVIKVPGANHDLSQGEVTEDGYFVFDADNKLTVIDVCGRILYTQSGPEDRFHHRASGYGGTLWIWNGDKAQLIDIDNGEVLKQFSLIELIAENEETPVFEARLIQKNFEGMVARWKYGYLRENPDIALELIALEDPFHPNDVDVLSPKMAALFPAFEVGDLLLSFRSINLITVIDPDTLKVKWFSHGEFSHQHDPDWGYNGEIIVYDNRPHSTHSRIISIDVETKRPRVLVDGEALGFYRFAGGNQHVHSDGRVLFNNGGEALQVNEENQAVFYFQNRRPYVSKRAYLISTVRYVTEEEFSEWVESCQM
jgi:hypothetical protein